MQRLSVVLWLCAVAAASAAAAAAAVLGPVPATALPGQVCQVPIVLTLDTAQADRMAFSLTVTPDGEAPALTADLDFSPAAGLPAPGVLEPATDSLVAAWFSPMTPLTGTVTLGRVLISFPPEAAAGQSYTVHMVSVGTSLGSAEVPTTPGADVLASVVTQYTLTVAANPPQGGTVTGGGLYDAGVVAVIAATPNPGWVFLNWTGDPVNKDAKRPANTITMDADRSITANFLQFRYEDDDPAILYAGTWSLSPMPGASAGHVTYATETNARATFTFTGTGIRWRAGYGPQLGKARVIIDDGVPVLVDLYSSTTKFATQSKTRLPRQQHALVIEVSGEKNRKSTGYAVDVDALEVVP